jgi:hypothetical protein
VAPSGGELDGNAFELDLVAATRDHLPVAGAPGVLISVLLRMSLCCLADPCLFTPRLVAALKCYSMMGEEESSSLTLPSVVEEIARLGTFRGVGLIVAPTGAGKTRLLEALVKRGIVNPAAEKEVWPEHTSVVSALAERCGGVQAAMSRLNAVGLNTVPEWVKPFSALSNGQQARVPHTPRRWVDTAH